jgi:hypothetical protein
VSNVYINGSVPLYSLEEASGLAFLVDKIKDGNALTARETEFLISIIARLKFGEPDELMDDEALEAPSSPTESVGHGVVVLSPLKGQGHGEHSP